MEVFKTLVALINGVAWPIVLLWIVLAFRTEIRAVLSSRSTRFQAGPFELGYRQLRVEVEAATDRSSSNRGTVGPAPGGDPNSHTCQLRSNGSCPARLRGGGVRASSGASSRKQVLIQSTPAYLSGAALAGAARNEGLISAESLDAVQGLIVLRDLVAHGMHQVDRAKAEEYLVLAEAVMSLSSPAWVIPWL